MVTADLLSRAQAGDGEAFRRLAGPHRRELQVHCYRMLGSFADAEPRVRDGRVNTRYQACVHQLAVHVPSMSSPHIYRMQLV